MKKVKLTCSGFLKLYQTLQNQNFTYFIAKDPEVEFEEQDSEYEKGEHFLSADLVGDNTYTIEAKIDDWNLVLDYDICGNNGIIRIEDRELYIDNDDINGCIELSEQESWIVANLLFMKVDWKYVSEYMSQDFIMDTVNNLFNKWLDGSDCN